MTTKILNKALGEAGAGMSSDHGNDTLYDVLKAMIDGQPPHLSARVATPTVAEAAHYVVDMAGDYDVSLIIDIGTAGTAGQTDVEVTVNGTAVAGTELTIDNADDDGSHERAAVENVTLAEGDIVAIDVTAVATGVAALTAACHLRPARVGA